MFVSKAIVEYYYYNIDTWAKCYKTFYSRNLWIFVKARVFVPGKPFQPSSLMFTVKGQSLHK
jgi:hypothetical protein